MNRFLTVLCVFSFLLLSFPISAFALESDPRYDWDYNMQRSPKYYDVTKSFDSFDVNHVSILNGNNYVNISSADLQKCNDLLENACCVSYDVSGFHNIVHFFCYYSMAFITSNRELVIWTASGYEGSSYALTCNPDSNTVTIHAYDSQDPYHVCGYFVIPIDDIDSSKSLAFLVNQPAAPSEAPYGLTQEEEDYFWVSVSDCLDGWGEVDVYSLHRIPAGTYNITQYCSNSNCNVAVSSCSFASPFTISDSKVATSRSALLQQSAPYYTLNQQTISLFNQILSAVQNIPQDLEDYLDDIVGSLNVTTADNDTFSVASLLYDFYTSATDYFYYMTNAEANDEAGLFQALDTGFASIRTSLNGINNTLKTGFSALGSYFGGFSFNNWSNNSNSFSVSKQLKTVIEDAYNDINNELNPLSDDNAADFEDTLDAFSDDTFIGSGLEVVQGVNDLSMALQTSGTSSQISVNTLPVRFAGGVNIPAKQITIDISWLGANPQFYSYYRTLVGAFITIAWFVLFARRIPALIAGAPMDFLPEHDSVHEDITVNDDGVVTKWTTTTRSSGVTTRQTHDL